MLVVGQVFGGYTVIAEPFRDRGRRRVKCRCDCGRESVVQVGNLLSGHSTRCRSCGCAASNRTHGETKGSRGSAEYRVWAQMIGRCHRPSQVRFADYGGRGIVVCERWRKSLANFIEDMGRRTEAEPRPLDRPHQPVRQLRADQRAVGHAGAAGEQQAALEEDSVGALHAAARETDGGVVLIPDAAETLRDLCVPEECDVNAA